MLILTRKCGESVIIDGRIEIKIGIDAPAEMKVYRKELYDTLEENKSAAGTVAAAALRDISRKME